MPETAALLVAGIAVVGAAVVIAIAMSGKKNVTIVNTEEQRPAASWMNPWWNYPVYVGGGGHYGGGRRGGGGGHRGGHP